MKIHNQQQDTQTKESKCNNTAVLHNSDAARVQCGIMTILVVLIRVYHENKHLLLGVLCPCKEALFCYGVLLSIMRTACFIQGCYLSAWKVHLSSPFLQKSAFEMMIWVAFCEGLTVVKNLSFEHFPFETQCTSGPSTVQNLVPSNYSKTWDWAINAEH